jgi:hypothetical protein
MVIILVLDPFFVNKPAWRPFLSLSLALSGRFRIISRSFSA